MYVIYGSLVHLITMRMQFCISVFLTIGLQTPTPTHTGTHNMLLGNTNQHLSLKSSQKYAVCSLKSSL